MNLLYLLISVAGVVVLVGFNLLLWGGVHAGLDADAVAQRLAQDVPGFRAGLVIVSADKSTVLIENSADRTLYLAVARGDRFVLRRLSHENFRAVSRASERLTIRLADFTLPRVRLALTREADAREWQERLERLSS